MRRLNDTDNCGRTSIYSNTSADEVRHLGETVFFTCFKEDLFVESDDSEEKKEEENTNSSESVSQTESETQTHQQ